MAQASEEQLGFEISESYATKDLRSKSNEHLSLVVRWNRDGPPKKVGEVACWIDILLNRPNGEEGKIFIMTEKEVIVTDEFAKDVMRTYGVKEAVVLVLPHKQVERLGTLRVS